MSQRNRPCPAGMKWCWRGQHHVPKSCFGRGVGRTDGLNTICRECKAKYERELRLQKVLRKIAK